MRNLGVGEGSDEIITNKNMRSRKKGEEEKCQIEEVKRLGGTYEAVGNGGV